MRKELRVRIAHTLIILTAGILFTIITSIHNPAAGICTVLITLGIWRLDLRILDLTRGGGDIKKGITVTDEESK